MSSISENLNTIVDTLRVREAINDYIFFSNALQRCLIAIKALQNHPPKSSVALEREQMSWQTELRPF